MTDKAEAVVDAVGGGVAKDVEEICSDLGYDYDDLTEEELESIDDRVFNCRECGLLIPVEDGSDSDPELCVECGPDDEE